MNFKDLLPKLIFEIEDILQKEYFEKGKNRKS